MSYNGCTNRETWLVKVYFEDEFYEYITDNYYSVFDPQTDDVHKLADLYKEYVYNQLEEELANLSPFLSDYLDLEGEIDWYDLANSIYNEILEDIKNMNDDNF